MPDLQLNSFEPSRNSFVLGFFSLLLLVLVLVLVLGFLVRTSPQSLYTS